MKFRKIVRRRALVVILTITMICQGIIPAYADTPDKHSESENIVSEEISEESIIPDEVVLASPDNAAYDSGKNEDITIEEVYEEDPLSADGLILGVPVNEEDERLIIGSEGTVLRVPENPKDIELVYSLEDDTYIGSTYSTEINNEYSDKSIFVQLTLTPLDPQQIAFGSREQKVKIPLSDMLELDDRIYFSIEASNEMKLTNSEVKDNWEVELSLLISDDENTELEDLTDGEMYHRGGYLQSGDDAFAFADSVLFTVENIKHTSFDPYSLLVVMAPQDTWWKSEDYQMADIDEIIFGQTPDSDIKETWNADKNNEGTIKCFIIETTGDDGFYRTLYIAGTDENSSKIMANPDSEGMFYGYNGDYNRCFRCLTKIDISSLDTSNVTNMEAMFAGCVSLEELDLSGFDTSSVTTMSSMFAACRSLKELDLSGFDTGNVTDMSYMFNSCESLRELDLRSFDTRNVTNIEHMFGCENLETIYSNDFDISNVYPGSYIFLYCYNLTGEKGTSYDDEHATPEYARVDGGQSSPGYFTSKESEQEEPHLYTVSFDTNGHGTAPASQQISAGGKVSKPADPVASGYTFGGWYTESSCINQWNFSTGVVNSNITLFAKWTGNADGIIPSGGNTGSGGSGRSSGGSGGSGGGGGSISKAKTTTGATYSPNWFVDASGVWKIRNSKGEIIKNAWLCDDVITANGQNVWYLLQADGSMLSAGLVQDNTGNFYSLETTHNGYFGMMRYKDGYYDCNGQQVYLKFNQKHDNSFGAVINEDGLEKLKQIYGITKYPIGNETCTYTSTF